jgi:hypothetical protein
MGPRVPPSDGGLSAHLDPVLRGSARFQSSAPFRRAHAGRRRPAPHAGKTRLRLIVLNTRVGAPNPTRRRRPAPRFSYRHDGMLRTAAAGRHARSGTDRECALEAWSTCRIAAACASGTRAEGGNRAEREVRGAFLPVRSSGPEAARTFLAAWHMSLRVSSYAPCRRQNSDAEADFRRAAPAAADR